MSENIKDRLKPDVGLFVSEILFSRNQAQVFHWQTKSFAAHKATQDYYEGIIPLIDSLVESYQFTGNVILNINIPKNRFVSTSQESMINYFNELLSFVKENKIFTIDTEILNIIDEIVTLIKSTLYKLKVLH